MRSIFTLAAAAASIVLAFPVVAGSVSDSHRTTAVGALYAGIFSATSSGIDDINAVGGWLAGGDTYLNHWFDPNWAVQLDGNLRYYAPAEFETGSSWSSTEWAVGGHLAYRDPDQMALGVFGALTSYSSAYESDGFAFGQGAVGVLGVEAQAYLDDVTLYGQAGVALPGNQDINTLGDRWKEDGTHMFVRGVVRYFPEDNIRLSAEGMLALGTVTHFGFSASDPPSESADSAILTGRLEAAYRPDESELSYFAAVEGVHNQQTFADITRSQTQFRAMAGLRFDLGADTLKSRDREGVTFDLPRLADALGTGNEISYCVASECTEP